jgi:hypothetical protein
MGTTCDNCTCGKAEGCAPDSKDFRKELEYLINRFSKENESNTPDFILAEYLDDCLTAYDKAVAARDVWTSPGSPF